MVDTSNYKLAHITEDDCKLLFQWANDEDVRLNSFSYERIKYEDHVKWFKNKIESKDSFSYLFKAYGDNVGLIRLDKEKDNTYIINYSIVKEHRKKGYGTELLKIIKEEYKKSILIGKVKKENIASIKAFIKAGYIMKEESDIYIFYSISEEVSTCQLVKD